VQKYTHLWERATVVARREVNMPVRTRKTVLEVGDRARSKLNRRIGIVDAVDTVNGQRRYGLHYDEAPQDRYLTQAGRDGAQLPPELIERV
jgi:hypothetical protein